MTCSSWKARFVARETTRLSPEAAGFVDRQVAPVAHKVKTTQLDRLVNEAIGRFMPAEVERLAEESWDKRHVTLHDQLVSFTGTMTLTGELDIADALDLEAAIPAGAEQRADLGSTESLDVRRAQAIGDLARGQCTLDLQPDRPSPRAGCPTRRQVVMLRPPLRRRTRRHRPGRPARTRQRPRDQSSRSGPGAAAPTPRSS